MQKLWIQNYGAFFDLKGAGVTGPVQLKGLQNGSTADLSSQQWTYQVIDVKFLHILNIASKVTYMFVVGSDVLLHLDLSRFVCYVWEQIGLKGEELGLSTGSSSLWASQPALPKNQPLVWYKVNFPNDIKPHSMKIIVM